MSAKEIDVRGFKTAALIAIAASGLFAAACTSSGTVIRAVRVFDGERVIPRADVLIEGARIVAMVPNGGGLRAAAEIDGSGKTLLPGLIDAHTHAFDGSLAQALRFGATTELDTFSMPSNLTRLRKSAESDDVADVRSAGVGAIMPKGHPIQIMAEIYGPFETVERAGQAKGFVAARIVEGSDYLKVVIDDGSASGRNPPVNSRNKRRWLHFAGHCRTLLDRASVPTESSDFELSPLCRLLPALPALGASGGQEKGNVEN